ncbi:MAG: SMP-30/gluconolactonase/LRE family protein [Akkermansiaceae bacterium]|nr:SMP-30/gluconolactonase/LRE family protein [Armatimonadota bacterium]
MITVPIAKTHAQELPPIFAATPKQLVPAKTVAEFPKNTFLENIVVDKSGTLFVTSFEDGKIYRVTPSGEKSEFAAVAGTIAGITFDRDGNLLVTGWAGKKTPSVFRVSPTGAVETLTAIKGGMFPNAITPLKGDIYLIADSYKGVIWAFDAQTNQCRVWLDAPALTRRDAKNPVPAVNGLKVFGNTLYATNTQRQQIWRIPISPDGKAGTPKLFMEKINGDDFALDGAGNLYVTTHFYNSVVRITPNKKVTIIAGAEQGMTGSTSLAFGKGNADRNALFVVTNGGMSLPPKGGVQPAKVVRLDIAPPTKR